MPFSIFRLTTLRGSNVAGLLIGMSLFSMFFFISLYLQQVLGYEPLKAGLAYLPLALTIIASAGIASALVTRIGFKPVLVTGLLFVAAGTFWFSNVSPGGTYVGDVLFPSLLAAIGLGFSFVTSTIGAVIGVRPNQAGLASGLINTSPAGGRGARPGDHRHRRDRHHQRRVRSRRAQPGDRADRGLPGRVPGVRGLRGAGRAAGRGDDLVEGQPRPRAGGAGGRAGSRARGRVGRASRATVPDVDEEPTTQELRIQQSERERAERAAAEEARESEAVGAEEAKAKHERRADKQAYLREKLEERAEAEREADAEAESGD